MAQHMHKTIIQALLGQGTTVYFVNRFVDFNKIQYIDTRDGHLTSSLKLCASLWGSFLSETLR